MEVTPVDEDERDPSRSTNSDVGVEEPRREKTKARSAVSHTQVYEEHEQI